MRLVVIEGGTKAGKKSGKVAADPLGRMWGRGAYICPSESCVDRALKRGNVFSRAFRKKVEAPEREVLLGFIRLLKMPHTRQ